MNKYLVAGICFVSFSVDAIVCNHRQQSTVTSQQQLRQPPQIDSVRWRQLPDVEVTAQTRPSVTKQSVPVQIIDEPSIRRLGIQELSEAVRRFSGVTVKDYGGIGGLKTVSIRSLGAHHTVVSYDGVPVADVQSGQVDISRFTLDNVAMVTLSMGQDDIFRPARIYASAGALDIKTRKPVFHAGKNNQLSVKIKGGSFGWLNPVLSYNRKIDNRWRASLSGDYMRADGNYPFTLINGRIKTREVRTNSDIKTFRTEANVSGDFGRGGVWDTKLYTFHSERGLPGAVNFYNKTSTERLWNDNSFIQTGYNNQLNEIAVRATAKYAYSYSRYREVSDKYASGYQEDRNAQQEYYGSAGALYTPSGIQGLSASFVVDYARAVLNNNFLNAPQPRRYMLLPVMAAQYKSNRVTMTGSLLGTYIADEARNGNPPVYRRLSPATAFSWQPLARYAWRIRVSYKDIFRTPTFTDLYYLRIGNTGLKPERAQQYNAGLTWNSGSFWKAFEYASLSIDGYRSRVKDKIVALPTLYIWRMMNMGEVETVGADVNATVEMRLSRQIRMIVSGNYTMQRAIDITDPKAKNYKHQIPYTPRRSGNGSVAVETPWLNISWLLTVVGERYALPQNTAANRVDGYAEQSVSAGCTFRLGTKGTANADMNETNGMSLRIQGELLNLTNAQYDVIQYYPMPGRSWRLSLILNL